MDVPLHPEIEAVLRQKVENGEYPSLVGLIEEALYLLMERDWSRSQAELQARMPDVFEIVEGTSAEGQLP